MAYSVDLRKRVVKAYQEGQSKNAVAQRYEISWWAVDSYIKRAEAGKLEANSPPGPKARLDEAGCELLKAQLEAHPDWSLAEHAEGLAETSGISLKKSAIDKYFGKWGISRKKKAFTRVNEMSRLEQAGGRNLARWPLKL
jgi:transposase